MQYVLSVVPQFHLDRILNPVPSQKINMSGSMIIKWGFHPQESLSLPRQLSIGLALNCPWYDFIEMLQLGEFSALAVLCVTNGISVINRL